TTATATGACWWRSSARMARRSATRSRPRPAPARGAGRAVPRPRTGSVYRHGDHFDIQITLPDGSRGRPECQPPGTSDARARDRALRLTQLAAKAALPGVEPKRKAKAGAPPAGNVWGVVTKALADSCKSKVRALRVRDTNPAAYVEGP